MKRAAVIAAALAFLTVTGAASFKLGQDKGFHEGYRICLLNTLNAVDTSTDEDEVCINGQCEAEQE